MRQSLAMHPWLTGWPSRPRVARGSTRARSLLIFLACAALVQGCQLFGFGGAHIQELATGAGKPSNVATFVGVMRKGKPVAGLPASAFQVEENGQPISAETSQLQLVDPARYAIFHAVLLVDLSQSTQPAARTQLAKAAAAFVRRARLGQGITVLAYDGGDKVRWVGEYSLDAHANAPEIVEPLVTLAPADPSRNLRGAVAQGVEILNRRLEANSAAVKIGTLAVFVRGPDLAGRFAEKDLENVLSNDTTQMVSIDVTGDKQDDTGEHVGASGAVHAQSADTLPIAFEEAATLVDGLREQYYLLSYCSPSRAGKRKLQITVSVPDSEGKDEQDSFSSSFDATGFTAACDPQKVPRLVPKTPLKAIKATGAPAQPAPDPTPAPPPAQAQPTTPAAAVVSKPAAPSTSYKKRPSGSAPPPAAHPDDDEAPVPAKPGYE